jgi:uncharacterized protein with HEPN domain
VSRHDRQRLDDIVAAIAAIRSYLERGTLSDGLVFDAVRDHLAHGSFDTSHAILAATVDRDLPGLEQAVHALLGLAGDQ